MERALRGDDLAAAGGDPRQLQRALDRLGAAGAKKGILEATRQNLGQPLREVCLAAVEKDGDGERQLLQLLADRRDDLRVRVTEAEHAQAAQEVQPLLTGHV